MLGVVIIFIVQLLVQHTSAINCRLDPSTGTLLDCCRYPKVALKAYDKCDKLYIGKEIQTCNYQCFFEEIGLFQNNDFNLTGAPEILSKVYKTLPELIPKVQMYYNTCVRKYKLIEPEIDVILPDGCNALTIRVFTCIYLKTFKSCPSQLWQNTNRCNYARQFVNSCVNMDGSPIRDWVN